MSDIDVSKIDVGWRVQLDATTFNNDCKKLHGVWATVSSVQAYVLGVVDDLEGYKRYIRKDSSKFLASHPPEPAKDPFAVGEWVVCVKNYWDVKCGELKCITDIHIGSPEEYFVSGNFGYKKSNFRPATPEEIAAHLGEEHEEERIITPDPVHHPKHYTSHPSGIECIQITEHMGFNLGNAMKYIWRADLKNDAIEDMKKAAWYINREIAKREKGE